jgi:hypothetical protein
MRQKTATPPPGYLSVLGLCMMCSRVGAAAQDELAAAVAGVMAVTPGSTIDETRQVTTPFLTSQSFLLSHTKRTGHSNQRGLLCRRLRPRWPRSRTPTARTETRCGQLGFKEKPLRIVWDPIETSPKSPLHFKGPIEILLKSPWTCIAGDGRCVQPHVHRQRRGEPRAGVPVRGAAGAAGTARRGAPTCPPQCGAVGVDAPTCAFL